MHTKIVVIRSPKFLSGILRAIFGIKKEQQEQ
ncbi:MAG: stage V sporulation protein SpoVM [Ruminococcus sp.]|nr:stage V sporulation protein SpoVM [Ruminococcus sp.]MBR6385224.1 stage V sporulation protein SpoVM [Ruminococcus sp.]